MANFFFLSPALRSRLFFASYNIRSSVHSICVPKFSRLSPISCISPPILIVPRRVFSSPTSHRRLPSDLIRSAGLVQQTPASLAFPNLIQYPLGLIRLEPRSFGGSISKDLMQQTSETPQNHGLQSNPLATFLDKDFSDATLGSQTLRQSMTHSVSLFRKYLQDKAQQGKSNPTEVEAMRPRRQQQQTACRALVTPPSISSSRRPPSFLEQGLLPRRNGPPTPNNQTSTAQLTIFYSGAINVYDNVPIHKAQAIMLLAHRTCSPNAIAPQTQTAQAATPTPSRSASLNLSSGCKLEADLPIARKHSLQRFLESRRNRILSRAPYPPASVKRDANEAEMNEFLVGTQPFLHRI